MLRLIAGLLLLCGSAWAQPFVPPTSLPWTSVAITPTPTTGAFTTASGTMRYLKVGTTVFLSATITITTNGTGAGAVNFPLPYTAASSTIIAGRETANTGAMLQGSVSGGYVGIFTYSNGYPGGSGNTLILGGSYETNQ